MNKEHIVSGNTHSKEQLNHYANQHNPNNSAYQANRPDPATMILLYACIVTLIKTIVK